MTFAGMIVLVLDVAYILFQRGLIMQVFIILCTSNACGVTLLVSLDHHVLTIVSWYVTPEG